VAADLGAVDRLGHADDLVRGDLEQREAVEQPDVADLLAVEARSR
jgi:hypothetical protein